MYSREIPTDRDVLEVYDALDSEVILGNGERGWKETFVASDPIDRFRSNVKEHEVLPAFRSWLDSHLPDVDVDAGAFGYVGYPVSREIEDIDREDREYDSVPDIAFGLYDSVVKIRENEYVVEAFDHPDRNREPQQLVEDTVERIEEYDAEKTAGSEYVSRDASDTDSPNPASLNSNFDKESYCDAVRYVKRMIREGETFQANISQRFGFETGLEPRQLYRVLRRQNPSPYMGLIDWKEFSIVSCSPELLVEKKDDTLRTRPIAGTRPQDVENPKGELMTSEKERAEHSILVDLERNDLGKISRYGSVEVKSYMEPTTYQEVVHLESVVEGEARKEIDAVDVVEAMFPGGTVTGAPKPRTLEIIDEAEPCGRGPYTGSMGRISCNNEVTLNILIRTLVTDTQKTYLQVGGGVVHDSSPESEYRETLDKTQGVLNALDRDWIT